MELDQPNEWDRPRLTNLRRILAELYPREQVQRRVVAEAKLDGGMIEFDAAAHTSWFNILEHTRHQRRVNEVLRIAMDENTDNELLKRVKEGRPAGLAAGPDLTNAAWRGPANARGLLEKIIGSESTLVSIAFLARGLRRARAVSKVVRADGASGSGFLTRDNLLITNNHVLGDEAAAAGAEVLFNYQQNEDGLDEAAETFKLAPGEFFATSVDDDWTAVRVAGDANAKWGAIDLRKATLAKEDRVNIIQHPGGGPKQLSYYANVVAYVGGNRVQYLTDTLPGSSGSPVFDRAWNLVALHHSGGWLTEPGSSAKETFYRNEGILIDAVIDGLAAARKKAGLTP